MSLLNYFGRSNSNKWTSEAVANIEETVQAQGQGNFDEYFLNFRCEADNFNDILMFSRDE